jgi:hypothetical protein
LDYSAEDQQPERRWHCGACRCRGENDGSGNKYSVPPDEIAELSAEDEERGQGHQTAVKHPLS